jgi:hypothetical protein
VPAKYPNVKNAHIVPETYLRNWAVDDKIAVWLVPEGKRLHDQSVDNVGTRRRFYRRRRPQTGEEIDDVEAMLGQGEAKATPLLRSFAERWPLSWKEKVQLAELFGYQLLRGPRWKAEYEARTQRFLDEYDRRVENDLPVDALEEQNALLLSDSHRLVSMFTTALTAATVLGSMHWTLVEFARPLLATSDHPVVLWPGIDSSGPRAVEVAEVGIMQCLEIRLALSPRHGVLMTWADHPDDEEAHVDGRRDHAANFNAFVVANADRQWFHLPGRAPPRASGYLLPLSVQLVRGYGPGQAAASQRRHAASKIVNKWIGSRELTDREIEVVTMSRTSAE